MPWRFESCRIGVFLVGSAAAATFNHLRVGPRVRAGGPKTLYFHACLKANQSFGEPQRIRILESRCKAASTLLQANIEAEKGPLQDYHPPYGALCELPC